MWAPSFHLESYIRELGNLPEVLLLVPVEFLEPLSGGFLQQLVVFSLNGASSTM